ncbi:MAG: ATP-binding protein [Hominisplanchenecus sp.]
MALKNTQYDTIMREYHRKQLANKRRQDACTAKAYDAVPELSEIDGLIASLSVEQARKLLDGDDGALDDLREQIAVLGERRRILLREHSFPEDYLEMHYCCPDCRDTGFLGNKKCHCFKQAVIDLLYTQSNIREILKEENFDTFCFDYYSDRMINPATGLSALATMQRLVAECREFIRCFDEASDNFFFYGDTGVGKTFLTHCISKELLESAHSVIYFSAFELFDLFSKTTFGKSDDIAELQQMHSYIFDCDLLIIDDLGTELTNSFVSSQLFLCINERLIRKKSTIISTNMPMDIFRDTYSERVFSRISSSYRMRKLIGDDIRIKKKLAMAGRKT